MKKSKHPIESQAVKTNLMGKSADSVITKKKNIKVDKRLCKKCEICVYFCPQQVFELDKNLFPKVINLEACTGCKLCELKCPDFAIEVEVGDEVSVGE